MKIYVFVVSQQFMKNASNFYKLKIGKTHLNKLLLLAFLFLKITF